MIIIKPFNLFNWNVRIILLHRKHDLDTVDKNVDAIINSVSYSYNLTPELIKGKSRKRECVKARWEVAYQLRYSLKMTTIRIGEILNRDHSTIIHALNTYKYENNLLP